MKNRLMQVSIGVILSVGLLAVFGCRGAGQTVHLDVVPKSQPAQMTDPDGVKIAIEPFEDRRADKTRFGLRTHLWGGETYFNVTGGKPGDVYAQALAERLKGRAWSDRSWTVTVGPAASVPDADIVISGQIFEFTAHAKSRILSTALSTSNKLTITARNKVDGSSTNRSLEGAQTDTVFWFSEDDVKQLVTETIKETLDRYISDTTISQRALRPNR